VRTRFKILIIGFVIISILLFLRAPLIIGQPECNDEIVSTDYDCRLWSNWNWIEIELLHCWELNTGKILWPAAYVNIGCL